MAQHIPMDKVGVKSLVERAKKLKARKFYGLSSLKWDSVEKNRFVAYRTVRFGGTDCLVEVVTDDDKNVEEVYLVA